MKISIKHTLVLAFVGLSLAVIGLMSKMLIQEIKTYDNSTRLSELAQLDASLFDGLLGLRGERGAISSAIKLETSAMQSSLVNLETGRKQVDGAFSTIRTLVDNIGSSEIRSATTPVLDAYAKWTSQRPDIDNALKQAVASRDPAMGKQVLAFADGMLSDLEKAANRVEATINGREPGMIMFTQLRSLG